ncbi:MAG: class II fructose-bisphosphate aldolase [Pseudomonadota bacterium]
MPFATLQDLLKPALDEGYAVAGLVCLGWEDSLAFVRAAEAVECPLILQAGPGARTHMPLPVIGPMLRHLADQASVPVCVHLDHGKAVDECVAAIDHGFTSLMFDGSALALGDNIAQTCAVVEAAHRHGISVEGEVGFVGYADGAASAFSSPGEAEEFERETGVDALAISVGNVHLQTEKSDGIDWQALAAIEAVTSVPLVLHGGSGIPASERAELGRKTKVCKFNIGTELRMVFGEALRSSLRDQSDVFDRNRLLAPVIEPLQAATEKILRELRQKP